MPLHTGAFTQNYATTPLPPPADLRLHIPRPGHDCLGPLRRDILDYAEKNGIRAPVADALILTATEIISNIIQHPPQPATFITLTLSEQADMLTLDICDDSTPFANFNAKCKESLGRLAGQALGESGNGLGLIQKTMGSAAYTSASSSADGHNHFTTSRKKSDPGGKDAPTKGKTAVFVIDDDDIFREMIVSMLHQK